MEKVLYIDPSTSFDKIRIEGQKIWGKELPLLGIEVDFLINKQVKRNEPEKLIIYSYHVVLLSRLFVNIPLFVKVLLLFAKNNYTTIVCRRSIEVALVPLILSKIFRKKFVYLMPFPSSLGLKIKIKIEKGIVKKLYYKLRYIIVYPLENYILMKSDYVFPISNKLKSDLLKRGIPKTKQLVVPMGVDESTFNSFSSVKTDIVLPDSSPLPAQYITYFGSFTRARGLEKIIKIFAENEKEFKDYHLVMMGCEKKHFSFFNKLITDLGMANRIRLFGSLPRNQLYQILANSTLSLSITKPIPATISMSPTKLMESLALGVPVIGNEEIDDQCRVLTESKGGFLCAYNNQSIYTSLHLALNKSHKELNAIGLMGKNYIFENRTYREIAKTIKDFIF